MDERMEFDNGEVIEAQEADIGEDNDYVDPLEGLKDVIVDNAEGIQEEEVDA